MTASRPFHLMAKPIGPLCNLRCDYCFYLSKKALFAGKSRFDFTMGDDVLEAYVRQYIEAQPEGSPEITFAWQGGEPGLLPISFFEKALSFERKYMRPGMRIINTVQTNGTLMDRSRAVWLADHGFLVGVSIDGPEDLHNRFRRDSSGQGTFEAVMTGIENLKAAGAQFNTLTVVQSDNAEHPERVYRFLKSIGSRYLQFIPIVEPEAEEPEPVGTPSLRASGERIGGGAAFRSGASGRERLVSRRSVRPGQWGAFMVGVFDSWVRSDVGRIYVQHFDMLLGLYAGYPPSMCVHAETCGGAMAIEHDGSVFSCDHFVFPEYLLGNVLEEPLAEIVAKPAQVAFGANKRDSLPEECRSCRYERFCRGGCPKDRLIAASGGRLNWLCEGYYALYEHTEPHFRAMAAALESRMPASEFRRFFRVPDTARPGRNEFCPCGSGRKFKDCHGRLPSV